jgi:hypothetical protein
MALSWSFANRVAGASSWTAADVAIVYSSAELTVEIERRAAEHGAFLI